MNRFEHLLTGIGLSENAAKIYLSLLDLGSTTITEISNTTKLQRVQIYRILPQLLEMQLVIVSIRWKKKFYTPASPERIEQVYIQIQEQNRGSINELMKKYQARQSKSSISYFQGEKWLQHIFWDIVESLEKWDIFYRITSETDTNYINEHYLPKNYRELRDKKKLERYVIMSSHSAKWKKPRLERDLKIIPENIDDFKNNVLMTVYKNKLAYMDFSKESAVLIENQEIAEFQKKLFMLLFKRL